jgi:hypothetical protein
MPGPVVYSAAAIEPRAILNDEHAVPAPAAGSPGRSVDGQKRGGGRKIETLPAGEPRKDEM